MIASIDRRLFIFSLAATVLAGSAFGQDDKSLVGTWNMTSETDSDPVSWTLTLKEVEGKLTAAADSGSGEQPVKDFTYTGGLLKFKTQYQGADYDTELKAAGSKLVGTWSGGGNSGQTSGTKK